MTALVVLATLALAAWLRLRRRRPRRGAYRLITSLRPLSGKDARP